MTIQLPILRGGMLAALLGCMLAGCGAPAAGALDDQDVEAVPDGKADDYFSPQAQEYLFSGRARITLDDADLQLSAANQLARARELMGLKTIEVAWFLNNRLTDKEFTDGDPKNTDANYKTYPGYQAIVRDGDYSTSGLTALADGKTYSFAVGVQGAGAKDLIKKLPGTMSGSSKKFTLEMGKVSNADLARVDPESGWFRDEQWGSGAFDPTKMAAADLEPIDLTVSVQTASKDAYLDLDKLYADGKLTIDFHFGWDYWSRYDVKYSKLLYEQLTKQGFKSPAKSFNAYLPSDGPLTKSVSVNGKAATVEVRIYHPSGLGAVGSDPDTDAGGIEMEQNMLGSLSSADVVIFSGHSGNFYGFALANWNNTQRGALDYPALSAAAMPKDRYQIVVAEGCDTFSVGQAFADNPNKPGLKNINVLTSNTFDETMENQVELALFTSIYGGSGALSPQPISKMLDAMNGFDSDTPLGAMFGLHGVDADPRLHPFANLDTLGDSCTANTDCGGEGNRCTKISTSKRVCSATCLGDGACPTGYRCRAVAATGTKTIVGSQCLK